MSKFKLGVVIVLCFLFSLPANSHQISQSFSNWTIEERNVTAIFSVAPRYITLLPVLDGYYDSLEDQLSNHLKKNIISIGYIELQIFSKFQFVQNLDLYNNTIIKKNNIIKPL